MLIRIARAIKLMIILCFMASSLHATALFSSTVSAPAVQTTAEDCQEGQIHVSKTVNDPTEDKRVTPGELLTFTITISATEDTVWFSFVDRIPDGLTIEETSTIGYPVVQEIIREGWKVEPGEPLTITYKARVDNDIEPGTILRDVIEVTTRCDIARDAVTLVHAAYEEKKPKKTLALIYMAGDNDLGDRFDIDALFNSAEMSADNPDVISLVLWDGPKGNDTYLYRLQHDERRFCPSQFNRTCDTFNREPLYEWGKTIWRWDSDNVANPFALYEFIEGAILAYPQTEQIVLSLVGHGNGWAPNVRVPQPRWGGTQPGGFLLDRNLSEHQSGTATLSTNGLGQALASAHNSTGRKIDLIYFDACSMAMSEVAYEISPYVDYMLASENLAWASFEYEYLISEIDGNTSPAEIGERWLKAEADTLHSYSGYYPPLFNPYTFSLFDLSQMERLRQAEDGLAEVLIKGLKDNPNETVNKIYAAWVEAERFDSDNDEEGAIDFSDNFIDLESFARGIQTQFDETSIDAATKKLIEATDDVVLLEDHEGGEPIDNYPYAEWYWDELGGISKYMPFNRDEDEGRRRHYHRRNLRSAKDGIWDELIREYWQAPLPYTAQSRSVKASQFAVSVLESQAESEIPLMPYCEDISDCRWLEGPREVKRAPSCSVVRDNADPDGFVIIKNDWTVSSVIGGYHGEDYLYTLDDEATARFIVPGAGEYQTSIRWTAHKNRATNVSIVVAHADGTETLVMNQEKEGGMWVSLGTYTFDSNSYVEIQAAGANEHVIADAVQFVSTDPDCVDTPDTSIYISPSQGEIESSQLITVEIYATGVIDLYGVQLEMSFDHTIVEIVDANVGTPQIEIGQGSFFPPDVVPHNIVNPSTGKIKYTATLQGEKSGMNGSGPIATIVFRGLSSGASSLNINRIVLSDSNSQAIPHEFSNGKIIVKTASAPYMDISGQVALERRSSNAGATVCVAEKCMVTSEDGSYEFPDVPITAMVVVTHPSYLSSSYTLAGTPGSTMVLPDVTLRGGDYNQDGVIDIQDAAIVGLAWNSTSGTPHWDTRADVTDDGVVNVQDLVAVRYNWRITAPGPWDSNMDSVVAAGRRNARPVMQFGANLNPNSNTFVSVSPVELTVAEGNNSELEIRVNDVSDLYGFTVIVTFDPAIVQVIDANTQLDGVQIIQGDFLDLFNQQVVVNSVDNQNGTAELSITQTYPAVAQSGSGILGRIPFQTVDKGRSDIQAESIQLVNAVRPNPQVIAAYANDGSVLSPYMIYLPRIER